ncbi:MAG: hypothetical protein ACRC5M_00235 [Anaeroplasmataceae bacterium]
MNDIIYNEVLEKSKICRKIHHAVLNDEGITLTAQEVREIRRAVFVDEASESILHSICFSEEFGKFK